MSDAPASVLVVDDSPTKRMALVGALEPLGLEVVEADCGRAGLRELLGREFVVVLLDINLPDMDGYEVAELLRARPKSAHTPILYITAERETDIDLLRGYATGAVDFILAPVVPEVLRSKVSVFVDLYRMRREAFDLAERLEHANRELESFSYSVSHDLRTPLRAIDGFARMLEEDYAVKLDDEAKRILGVVRENSQKMGMLIDDLLTFSKLGRQAIVATTMDMNVLVKEVIRELRAAGAGKSSQIVVANLPKAWGDRALLKQVWVNLLSNAAKFAGKKDAPVIEVSGHNGAAEVVYRVKDNGVGFDMQYYNKLFGVFQRLHSGEQFAGTGVGLAIVQRIVTRHGGRVWADGKVNEGAMFYFALPQGEPNGRDAAS